MRDRLSHARAWVRRNRRIVLSVIGVPVVAVVLWALLEWQIGPSDAAGRKDVLTLLAQVMAGLVLLLGVYLTYRRVTAAEETVRVAQEGQITERFTRAIEQLGSDRLEVRLGGIYALERIARDSERDHWPIMEVLTAFVRENARWKGNTQKDSAATPDDAAQEDEQPPRPRADIQAILTVIGRRKRWYGNGEDQRLDLRETDLRGADLIEAHLEGANLYEAHLEEAVLIEAHLEGANLGGARLERAYLDGAHLEGASLGRAHLEEAWLDGACLEGAWLVGAHLEGALLIGAHLEGARLYKAQLERASLSGVDLGDAHNLTQEQIEAAVGNERTKLPPHLTMPDSWKESS